MSVPEISVLMPVKNGMPFLEEALPSILSQTFRNFEIVAIDDGSDDASVEYLSSIEDKRLRVFKNDRTLGVTETLLKGWGLCRANLVARMDADDISMPTRFERQKQYFDSRTSVCVLGTGAMAFGDREFHWRVPEAHDALQAYLMFDCVFPHTSVMIRKSEMDRLGLIYDKAFRQAQDYELWTRTSINGCLGGIDEPLVRYRFHDKAVTAAHAEAQRQFADAVRSYSLKMNLDFDLSPLEVLPMRQLAGVYAHRFAKTGAELAATKALKEKLMIAASSQAKAESFTREIEARWGRVVNWATPEARQTLGV